MSKVSKLCFLEHFKNNHLVYTKFLDTNIGLYNIKQKSITLTELFLLHVVVKIVSLYSPFLYNCPVISVVAWVHRHVMMMGQCQGGGGRGRGSVFAINKLGPPLTSLLFLKKAAFLLSVSNYSKLASPDKRLAPSSQLLWHQLCTHA